jgi:crotonobetainyl-CoA:carnitine CoA-transferase CaiB-like acyl-CoA transferase
MRAPLQDLRVVEIAGDIAGPYCGKLLAGLGAEVYKIEPPSGDPLRAWGPFPGGVSQPERSGLFAYLNAGKQGGTLDLEDASDLATARSLVARADVLIDGVPPGTLDRWGLDIHTLKAIRPGLVVVRISNFGQEGPWRDRAATPLTLQAASGWITSKDPNRPPVQAGVRIPEYIGGAYAALAALTALRIRSTRSDRATEIDVSMLESILSTLPYPMLIFEKLSRLGIPPSTRAAPILGIVQAADGRIGINCLTGQHWLDVCALLGLPEFAEHQAAVMMGGPERADFFEKAEPWLAERTVDEILDTCQAMRLPAAPVGDGATMLDFPQYTERGFFVEGGADGWSFHQPGVPYRLSKTPVLPLRGAPTLGPAAEGPEAMPLSSSPARPDPVPPGSFPAESPFAGIKVLDLSTFWSGAYVTCYLGAFGADIVKVESIQRPDGHRYSGAFPFEGDDWYERSVIWQGTNLNKRDLTLDLGSERGRELARRLAAEADVVIENFSPRVVEEFGLDYASLARINPDVILVRMPGFGLEGPWRDYVGWALSFEQMSGMAAVTGYPDGPPCNLQGPADPIVGVHAGIALLAALEHRRRSGEGQQVEVAQIEVAACLTAEPVIEYSMNGAVPPREGNRQRGYAQGVYPTGTDDAWVALSVRNDDDWSGLVDAMGRSELLADSRFASARARETAHDAFDEIVADWTRTKSADEIVDGLQARNIPAERLLTPDRMYDEPPLVARGFYEEHEHPVTGLNRYPGWPFRITPGPKHHHRWAPPTLGQHNDEILRRLGLSDADLAALRQEQVIGDRPLGI